MRVLHVAAVPFTLEKLLLPLLSLQREDGIDVAVAANFSGNSMAEQALSDYRPASVPFPRRLDAKAMMEAALDVSRLIRHETPDLIHLHTPAAALSVRMLPRTAFRGAKIYYTVHGFSHPWPPVARRDRVIQRIERLQARRTAEMLFVSAEDLEHAQRRGYRSRLTWVGNGVGSEWLAEGPKRRLGPDLNVVYVGRLVKEKGVLDLIRAVGQVTGVRLRIVGEALPSDRDPAALEARRVVAELGLAGRVEFAGMMDPAQVRRSLQDADIGCLPSYREGLPVSVIEQLAGGLPCVVTDIRGSRELVTHERNGYVAQAGDPESLARGLLWARELTTDQFKTVSQNAIDTVRSTYTLDQVHRRILAAYSRCEHA